MRKKKIYNSKTIRISLGDYALLSEISQQDGITFAEALHLVITDRARQNHVVTPKTQIPMPLTTAYRVIPITAYQTRPQSAIATNGSKHVAFRIKPKGARYE